MSLGPGSMIGPFKIQSLLGKGGMGEVFSAIDTRLDRNVAIKILPPEFVSDADRLRRFQSEAKTLASVNHPNILIIHEIGADNLNPYLVSELLEGHTLREELNGNPLPVRKATDYALQIAHGLAAAHACGVIHRDLKPENIFVTTGGRVKILDFGLAKAAPNLRSQKSNLQSSESPTILGTTTPGMMLGTPGYMSPEQVRSQPADHRSDIFAFGCVLYEMLSGRALFRRDTVPETMAAILNEEPPDLPPVQPDTPETLNRIVRRCLEKSPERRFHSAADLAFALESVTQRSTVQKPFSAVPLQRLGRRGILVVTLLLLALVLGFVSGRQLSPTPAHSLPRAPLRKLDLRLPTPPKTIGTGDQFHPAISPDGTKLAYANADGLWLRSLDRFSPPIRLVSADNILNPFWSPDGGEIGYFENRRISRIGIHEGRPRPICTAPDDCSTGAAGGAWLTRERIVFGTGWNALYEVMVESGKISVVDKAGAGEEDFHNPSALPEGRGVLLSVHRTSDIDTIAVWTKPNTRKVLLQIPDSTLFYPVYCSSGHVLFQRSDEAGGIWAFPFSLEKLERTDEPFRVADFGTVPTVSAEGTLAYGLFALDEFSPRQLTWVDRSGKILSSFGPVLPGLAQQRISPDGQHVLVSAGETLAGLDIWSIAVATGGQIPIARQGEMEGNPFWWKGQSRLIFSRRDGTASKVFVKSADGTSAEGVLLDSLRPRTGSANAPMHLSSDGRFLFAAALNTNLSGGVGYFDLSEERAPFHSFPSAYQNTSMWNLSPDQQLLAFQSADSGLSEVYTVEFPKFSGRTIVSRGGGRHPAWHPNGQELFYISNDGKALYSARLTGRVFENAVKLFDLPETIHGGFPWWPSFYDVAGDGQRFLMLRRIDEKNTHKSLFDSNLLIVQNWFEEFRRNK